MISNPQTPRTVEDNKTHPSVPKPNPILGDPGKRVPTGHLARRDLPAAANAATGLLALGIAGPLAPLDGLERRRRQHDADGDDQDREQRFGDDVGRQRRDRGGRRVPRGGVQRGVLVGRVNAVVGKALAGSSVEHWLAVAGNRPGKGLGRRENVRVREEEQADGHKEV